MWGGKEKRHNGTRLRMGDDIKTVLKDITNGRLRRCIDFPNQTFSVWLQTINKVKINQWSYMNQYGFDTENLNGRVKKRKKIFFDESEEYQLKNEGEWPGTTQGEILVPPVIGRRAGLTPAPPHIDRVTSPFSATGGVALEVGSIRIFGPLTAHWWEKASPVIGSLLSRIHRCRCSWKRKDRRNTVFHEYVLWTQENCFRDFIVTAFSVVNTVHRSDFSKAYCLLCNALTGRQHFSDHVRYPEPRNVHFQQCVFADAAQRENVMEESMDVLSGVNASAVLCVGAATVEQITRQRWEKEQKAADFWDGIKNRF